MEAKTAAAEKRAAARAELCEFLATIAVGECNFAEENDELPFYESGMVDSLSMLELVSFLERRFAIDFSRIGIDVVSLGSIANILDLIDAKEP
jgi:acyl carrier protein